MKLSIKIFLFTLILFVIAFYMGIFLMSGLSYTTSLETARKQAFAEYNFIVSSFYEDLSAIIKRNQTDRNNQPDDLTNSIDSFMAYYMGFYKKQDVFLKIENQSAYSRENKLIAGNLPGGKVPDAIQDPGNEFKSVIANEGSEKYIYISGEVLTDYTLIYSRDITGGRIFLDLLTK